MDEFNSEEELKGTFAYLDNVTICGRMQVEHDNNLNDFLNAAKWCNITYSPEKCVFSVTELHILGCVVKNGEIQPDPERLHPFQQLPVPSDRKAHKCILGFFSYYSNRILGYSDKILTLVVMKTFPYIPEAAEAFKVLKKTIDESVVCSIDESVRFDIETDVSDFAIEATLSKLGIRWYFFSLSPRAWEMPCISREGSTRNNRDCSSLEVLSNRLTFLTQDGPDMCCLYVW